MGPKGGVKKSAKSEDDIKKKETGKSSRKGNEDGNAALSSSNDLASASNDNPGSTRVPPMNLVRGTSQLGTPSEENTNREPGVSNSELSHHTDGNREGADAADNSNGVAANEVPEIKYEEPILPNLIVLRFD